MSTLGNIHVKMHKFKTNSQNDKDTEIYHEGDERPNHSAALENPHGKRHWMAYLDFLPVIHKYYEY